MAGRSQHFEPQSKSSTRCGRIMTGPLPPPDTRLRLHDRHGEAIKHVFGVGGGLVPKLHKPKASGSAYPQQPEQRKRLTARDWLAPRLARSAGTRPPDRSVTMFRRRRASDQGLRRLIDTDRA